MKPAVKLVALPDDDWTVILSAVARVRKECTPKALPGLTRALDRLEAKLSPVEPVVVCEKWWADQLAAARATSW